MDILNRRITSFSADRDRPAAAVAAAAAAVILCIALHHFPPTFHGFLTAVRSHRCAQVLAACMTWLTVEFLNIAVRFKPHRKRRRRSTRLREA